MRRGPELMLSFEANLFDHGTAQTSTPLVQHRELTGRRCALRRLEFDPGAAIGTHRHRRRLSGLAVTQLDVGIEAAGAPGAQPVKRTGGDRPGLEPVLLVPLHHDQRVALDVLARDVPGFLRATALAANRQPGALPEGIERQAAMLSEQATVD